MPRRFRRTVLRRNCWSRTNRLRPLKQGPRFSGLCEAIRERHLHLIAFDADRAAGNREVGVVGSLAATDVKFPSMPGAFDNIAGQRAFSERSSRMGAGIVDCVERSVDVEQGDPDSLHLNRLSCSRWKVLDPCDGHEFPHGSFQW